MRWSSSPPITARSSASTAASTTARDSLEESVRVPMIIRDPQRPYSRGRRVDSMVSLVDVAPTIMNALG
jgi:arylsulfatase A-like enzyme